MAGKLENPEKPPALGVVEDADVRGVTDMPLAASPPKPPTSKKIDRIIWI